MGSSSVALLFDPKLLETAGEGQEMERLLWSPAWFYHLPLSSNFRSQLLQKLPNSYAVPQKTLPPADFLSISLFLLEPRLLYMLALVFLFIPFSPSPNHTYILTSFVCDPLSHSLQGPPS